MSWIYNDAQQNVTFMDPDNPFNIDYYVPSTEWELVHTEADRQPRWKSYQLTSLPPATCRND